MLYRLHGAGFRGCLVGGSVRDLLLGRLPKDYDVATDARPAEVRRLFRNSRVIGRRFRLVHVYFKEGIVEVSTFRRDPNPEDQESGPGELLITDDNVFGSPEEDAFRRDFTVNALFYDIADFSVIDYVGGLADLERRLIRAIGDPDVRFREDPVRMVRACELAGRLGFAIEKESQEAIHRNRRELEKASTPRLTEELGQLLRCGHAGRALQWMLDLGLLEVMLPEAYAMVGAGEKGLGRFGRILPQLDAMVGAGREIPDTGLSAALLLPNVLLRRRDVEAIDQRPLPRAALQELVRESITPFFSRFTLSGEKAYRVVQAIMAYFRLGEPEWRSAARVQFAGKPYFDDALLLAELMAGATGEGREELERWRAVRERRAGGREESEGRKPRRRRRRRHRPEPAA